MIDRLPFHPADEGGQGNRDIREHEKRESKQVNQFFPRRRLNLPPFTEHGNEAVDKKAGIKLPHGREYEAKGHVKDPGGNVRRLCQADKAEEAVEGNG